MKLVNEDNNEACHSYPSISICVLFFFNMEALQSSLKEQQSGLNYLSTTVKDMSKNAPSDISQKYQSEFEEIEGRWKKLSSQLVEYYQKLEDQMSKLRKIQVIQDFTFYVYFFFTHFSLNYAFIKFKGK